MLLTIVTLIIIFPAITVPGDYHSLMTDFGTYTVHWDSRYHFPIDNQLDSPKLLELQYYIKVFEASYPQNHFTPTLAQKIIIRGTMY